MPSRNVKEAGVQRSIQIRAPPERVYTAFEDEERMQKWYFDDAQVDLRPGGAIRFEGPEGEMRANILAVDPEERIVFEYEEPWWGVVTVNLKETRTGTRLTLTHEGFEGREEWASRFNWAWQDTLKQLKAECEGRLS